MSIELDTFECIKTKLDIGEYDPERNVGPQVMIEVLEAARLTGSGINSQHWRFVLIHNKQNLKNLANDSTTGQWVGNCSFAMIVLTDPSRKFHQIDAGRVAQDMQLAAWNRGVGSRLFTGIDAKSFARDFKIPENLSVTLVLGFGYPKRKIVGKKDRKPISEIAFDEAYGTPLDLARISKS